MPAYTGATTGFAAGAETNTSAAHYAQEVNYNQPPPGAYQAIRYTDISLAVNETESQPDEINDIPEMAQSVLTGRTTQGSISGILSAGTFEDMLAGVMTSDWLSVAVTTSEDGSPYVIQLRSDNTAGIAEGIYGFSKSGNTVSDTFSDFPNSGVCVVKDINGGTYLIPYNGKSSDGCGLSITPGTIASLGLTAPYVCDAGSSVTFNGIVNGKIGKTFTFCQFLASKWQIYSGTMVNQVQITLQKGQPATISIDLVGSDMTVSDTNIAASVTPRTATPLINTVDGFMGCKIFGNVPAGCIQSATLTLSRDGSGQDTGMGHVGACGVRLGSFKAALEITYLFRDYQQFTDWQAGKTGPVSIGVKGSDGIGYQFTVLNGIIRNPKTPISGKNQTVVATVSVTANPVPGGGTFAITRISS